MDKKKLLIIIVILVVIVAIVIKFKGSKSKETSNNEVKNSVTVKTVKNEVTGEDEYVVYDKSGQEKTRVKDEYQLKIYEIDPDYEELEVPTVTGE